MEQKLLIWLRRFRPTYGKRFRFHTALAEACSGLAYPVTIQDRSYSSTMLGSFFGRGWFVLPVAFLAFMIGMVTMAILSIVFLPGDISELSFGIGVVLLFVLTLYLTIKAYRRLGYKFYGGQDASLQVVNELDSIKSGKRRIFRGVDVFKCENDVWQDVVAAALSKADIAVIDVSEVTENLEWEISKAFESLFQDRIIFVLEHGADKSTDLKANLNQLLSRFESGQSLDAFNDRLISFPSKWAEIGPGRRRQVVELAKRLRIEIAKCLNDS
jgi:hypothetical protein